jgi:predicted Zn finger-like uncharacterized protein
MAVTTKLECAHCGAALRTTKIMLPGAKVKCPKCKNLFQVHASDDAGLVETIPLGDDGDALVLDAASSYDDTKAIVVESGRLPSRADGKRGVPAPARPAAATPTKKLDSIEGGAPFSGTRGIIVGIAGVFGVSLIAGFLWWYVSTVKALDTAAVKDGSAVHLKIESAAAPVQASTKDETKATAVVIAAATTPPPSDRTTAPNTAEMGDLVVGIATARVGPLEQGDGRSYLTLGLRITNQGVRPFKFMSWSETDVAVILRDRFGNYYNRVSSGASKEVSIKPHETITERLVFEPVPVGRELTVDLPIAGSEKPFKFLVTAGFIERAPIGLSTVVANQAVPIAPPLGTASAPPPPAPTPAAPYDPEKDEKLRLKIRTDYNESMADINRRKLGKTTNEGLLYKRREVAKLWKRLAEENNLTEDQIKRMTR